MTIAGWGRPSQTNEACVVASVGAIGGSHRNQVQFNNAAGLSIFAIGASGTIQVDTSQTYSANTWNHAAGVFTSATSRTPYLNGVAGATNTGNCGSQNTADSILIGVRANPSLSFYMNGLLAEVGIWSVALTAAEVASLADGMTCDKVRPQSLVFYAPLVRELIDARGGLTITNNNTATVANHPRVYA
jgi:hypothetical protein